MIKHFLFILLALSIPCIYARKIKEQETIQTKQHQTVQDNSIQSTMHIFSPGFIEKKLSTERQVQRYKKNNIIQGSYTTCTYNDDRESANFGQEDDITILNSQYQGSCNTKNQPRIVLTGLSRGAATLFTFLASKKPKNIAAVIAESPFACLEDVVEHRSKEWKLNWVPGIKHIMGALVKMVYPAYKPEGITPITSIQHLEHTLPIVITCSKQDALVPYTSSVRLAQELKDLGHEVYLLIFQKGQHGFLSYKEEFQQVVNALYARYNLPHNEELAHQGTKKIENYKL